MSIGHRTGVKGKSPLLPGRRPMWRGALSMAKLIPAGTPFYIFRQQLAGFLFLLPALLFTLVFLIGPIAVAVVFSFTRYNITPVQISAENG